MFDTLQLIGGLIITIGNIPQILQILRTKSVKDLNTHTFYMAFIGITLMEIYAINLVIHKAGLMFLITNSMGLVITGFTLSLILKYKKQ